MATSWYKDTEIGKWGSKMRVRVDVVRQSRSSNYTRVKVRIYAYNGGSNSKTYNLGRGAAVAVSGTVSHSDRATFSIGPRSWGTLADWEFSVDHDSDGEKSFSITGKLSDTGTSALGSGGSINVKGTFSPLYLTPTAPTWGSTEYTGTERIRAAWNNRSSARGRYDKIRVQRWARSTGKWYHRALLSGSATSYTDTSLSSNDEHRWRVRAEGKGGNSGWVQGGTIGTTPADPTRVKARKSGQSIKVSWTDNAGGTNRARTFYIDDNPGGTGWDRVGEIGGSATSWTHSDADPAVTHQYRVWARIFSAGGEPTSGSSSPSATVQLQAAPGQPRRVGPPDVTTREVGDTLTLEWEHLPVDTTDQEAAEVKWRIDGGEWETETVTGAANTLDVTPAPAGARAQLEWRVRTRGAHPDWSPWSTTNGPLLSTRPLVLIQAPVHGEPLLASRVEAAWTFEPGGTEPQLGQSEWTARLSQHATGTVIETESGGTSTSASLDTRLENGTEYALTIRVRNGDGLWSDDDRSVFTTDFPLPAIVEAFPEWDQGAGAVSIGFGEPEQLRATYQWTGEAGASTSEAVDGSGNVVATNLAENPLGANVENTDGWSAGYDSMAIVEDGGRPVAWVAQETSSSSLYAELVDRPAPPPGTIVRWSVDVKVSHPTEMRASLGTVGGGVVGPQPPLTGVSPEDGWVRHTTEIPVTEMPDGGGIRFQVMSGYADIPAGGGLWVRDAMLTFDAPDNTPAFFDGDSPGVTDADAIDVERREPDGSWTLIASAIDTSSTITDRTPHIGNVEYRAISRTALPTEAEGPAATAVWVHDRDPVFVNGSTGMDQVCLARGNTATDDHDVDQALHRFAGQEKPTAFFGIGHEHRTSFSGKILPHYHLPVSSRAEWVALLRERSLVCLRDCTGRKVFGVLGVSFGQTGNVETVDIEVEQAAYIEGVARVSDLELEARKEDA